MSKGIDIQNLRGQSNVSVTKKEKSNSKESASWLQRDISIGGKTKFKSLFFSELGLLLEAGVDIRSSLEIMKASQKKNAEKHKIESITNDLIKGRSFSKALLQSGSFDEYDVQTIKIGEESGKLQQVLNELATYYNNSIEQRRQIINAMTYPVLVLVSAVGAIFFFLRFIIPVFEDVFTRMGGELPGITQWFIWLSHQMKVVAPVIIGLILLVILLNQILKQNEWYQMRKGSLKLRLPILGDLTKIFHLQRFSSTMALLLESGVPLVKALELNADLTKLYPFKRTLTESIPKIIQGAYLYETLQNKTPFDKRYAALLKVGESSGKLPVVFRQLSNQYQSQLSSQTKLINSIMEPLLIILVGLIVGVMLVAMYLPLFELNQAF